MEITKDKCVIILDESLPLGRLANAAAVLSMSLGKSHPHLVGAHMSDHMGQTRAGITTVAIPVLKGSGKLNGLREALMKDMPPGLTVIDLIDATAKTRSYEEYTMMVKNTPVPELNYYGIALYGPEKIVNRYAGSLGLLK
jgi:hypothetical protein